MHVAAGLLGLDDSSVSGAVVAQGTLDGELARITIDNDENKSAVKTKTVATWPMTSLLDMLKEADLRLNFTHALKSATAYETLDRSVLRPRFLLCLQGIGTNAQRQLELALQQARFSAAHAGRQYDAVDPANRLAAGELERCWNEALQALHRIEDEIAAIEASKPAPLGEKERRLLMQLGADLELAWSHPAATAATRKRILRAALHEIVVRIDGGFIDMVLRWQGGDHTALKLKMNRVGKHRWVVPEDTLSLIRELARLMPDQQIARLLNRAGKPTGRGDGWTKVVCSFRSHHGIAVYREGEWAERGEITLAAATQIMGVRRCA